MKESIINVKKRTILAMLGVGVAVSVAAHAIAGEQSYYKGDSWEVLLKTPGTDGEKAYCALRSSNWAEKSIAIEYNLTGTDEMTPSLRVTKQRWGLPLGQSTKVAISNRWGGAVAFDTKVVNSEELYGELPANQAVDGSMFLGNILNTMIRTVKPAPLVVVFEGNEPIWFIPAVDFGEALSVSREFKNCLTELRKLRPSLFKSTETSPTSPFAKSTGQNGFNLGSSPSNNADASRPSTDEKADIQDFTSPSDEQVQTSTSSWAFEKREEDWGDTCYVKTTQGDVLIGFMVAPGKDLVGFVENGFTGSVKATWKIDGAKSYVADGEVADYSGWHEFYEISEDILTDAQKGKQMTITDTGGKTIALSLASAPVSLRQFINCFGRPAEPTSKTTKNTPLKR